VLSAVVAATWARVMCLQQLVGSVDA
jgi:hypothetical protein